MSAAFGLTFKIAAMQCGALGRLLQLVDHNSAIGGWVKKSFLTSNHQCKRKRKKKK